MAATDMTVESNTMPTSTSTIVTPRNIDDSIELVQVQDAALVPAIKESHQLAIVEDDDSEVEGVGNTTQQLQHGTTDHFGESSQEGEPVTSEVCNTCISFI